MRRGQRAAGGRRGGCGRGGGGLADRVAAGGGGAACGQVRRRHRGNRPAEGADTGAPLLGTLRLGAAAQLAFCAQPALLRRQASQTLACQTGWGRCAVPCAGMLGLVAQPKLAVTAFVPVVEVRLYA